ncbi:GNAT family N-acetyltransferase [Desertivirga xinjiangensis]|uniref:GNAT family N-acetyltransferase n=1 Tax=Desertivirga xinjiangensis TaxID=539206 RepID=UPI00210A300D|nr:GNAT family N-acetyltransferase [Pedobacter xinjiangensis]
MTEKSEVIIRAYTYQDKERVLDLLRFNTPQFFSPNEEGDLLYYLENEIEYYYVIELDRQVIGSGGFNFSGDYSKGKISWDLLHPDFQKRSFGSTLLKYRIKKLKEFSSVREITVRTSQQAYKFYEKHGFQLQGIIKDYWAIGFDLYNMKYLSR